MPTSDPGTPPPGDKEVWYVQREIDGANLYSDDLHTFLYDQEKGSKPVRMLVDAKWYAKLPEDPGP